jgi:hypothetical protein
VSNVAVVSEPFAGREVFLNYAEEVFGVATGRLTLEEIVTDDLPEFPVAEIVLIDNCHYLYSQQIGGFDPLNEFLDRVATQDVLYVTSWNRYAWSYLTAVTDVRASFPTTIQIPRLGADGIAKLIESYHGLPLPMFVEEDDTGRLDAVDIDSEPVSVWGDRTVSVPYPVLNTEYVFSRFRDEPTLNIQAVVYERIAQLSEGDPGAAIRLWDQSIRDDTIAPAYIQEVGQTLQLNHQEAFVLELVLTNEQIDQRRLEQICTDVAVDRALQTLLAQEVITVEDGRIGIVPEQLYTIVEHLVRRQLVW